MKYTISRELVDSLPKDELMKLMYQQPVNLGWWNNSYENKRSAALSNYADGFFNAASEALENFAKKPAYSDADSLPLFFLIFHFIEVALKSIIETKLEWVKANDADKQLPNPPQNHKVPALLDFLLPLFRPDEPFLSVGTQEFIRKMAWLNGHSAQAFRYPFDKKGEVFWEDKPVFSMGLLKAEFDIHGLELNGFQSGLRTWMEEEQQARYDQDEPYSDEAG